MGVGGVVSSCFCCSSICAAIDWKIDGSGASGSWISSVFVGVVDISSDLVVGSCICAVGVNTGVSSTFSFTGVGVGVVTGAEVDVGTCVVSSG